MTAGFSDEPGLDVADDVAQAIRAQERERLKLMITWTCACKSCKDGIAKLLDEGQP
jgi:hypothetical protein